MKTFAAVNTYLFVKAEEFDDALTFYQKAFEAEETPDSAKRRNAEPGREPLQAELKLAGSIIILSSVESTAATATTIALCIETEDVIGSVGKSVDAGASKVVEPSNVEGRVEDPYGFIWIFSTQSNEVKILLDLFPTHQDISNAFNLWKGGLYNTLLFSWVDKRPECLAEQLAQDKGNCWAIAMYRQWYAAMILAGREFNEESMIGIDDLVANNARLLCDYGLEFAEDVIPYMKSHGVTMSEHYKPAGSLESSNYERFLEGLLLKCPLSVHIKYYPSYEDDAKFRGILCPSQLEKDKDVYVDIGDHHSVLLVGKGINLNTGKKFWQLYDSQGVNHGHGGFIYIAMEEGLILSACQMQFD